jgi:hypothetical protein
MTSPLPAHLAAAIRERIAVLRVARHLDDGHPTPQTPTFPRPHHDDARSKS